MHQVKPANLIDILLVEDSPTDVLMTREALSYHKVENPLHVVSDGVEAMRYLHQHGEYATSPLPGLIILDLNLPRMGGDEVLSQIKADERFKRIPVVILTTSQVQEDISRCYQHYANSYICKPLNFSSFTDVIRIIKEFWLGAASLPTEEPLNL